MRMQALELSAEALRSTNQLLQAQGDYSTEELATSVAVAQVRATLAVSAALLALHEVLERALGPSQEHVHKPKAEPSVEGSRARMRLVCSECGEELPSAGA